MRITRVFAVCAVVAAIAVPVALAFGFVDGKVPPSGIVGTPYGYQFVGSNGCPPNEYVIKSGSLPDGLSLSSSGLISGTPTTPGSFLFWAELHDKGCCGPAVSCSTPSQRPFRIDIAAKLTVTTASPLAPLMVGVPYSLKLTADGGGSQSWSIASGVLPAGLGLSADGTLSGTPTTATPDPVDITVKVTDGPRTDTKTLRIEVVTPLAATTPTIPASEVGHALKPTTLGATGGRAPYTWALVSNPAWIVFDPGTVSFTGTPDAAGSFPVQLTVKDVYGTTVAVNLLVAVKAKVVVKTVRLPITKVGKLFSATLRTAGGVTPFSWKVTSGKFPVGIRLNRTTGVLSGKAQKAGTFPLTFTVKDALGETSEASLVLTVNKKKK
jgi:hypothetical protein